MDAYSRIRPIDASAPARHSVSTFTAVRATVLFVQACGESVYILHGHARALPRERGSDPRSAIKAHRCMQRGCSVSVLHRPSRERLRIAHASCCGG